MLITILSSQGALCTAAANGREAMYELEAKSDFDIVLLDLQMPIMDGFEVLSQCKSNPYLRDIPIIVLAANRHEKINSLKLGANDFMSKPYEPEELELRITRLVNSSRQAQSAKRAKAEFLAIASHELRTPMHQILGVAELLDGENLGNEQREFVDIMKKATNSLTSIISDILDYVQLDHGSLKTLVEPFSLRSMLQHALDSNNKARINLSIADDVSDDLYGPSFYVSKIFGILIENAVKFSSDGEIRITIREEPQGKFGSLFCCSVSDPGIGISAEFHKRIFDPFVQVDSSRIRRFEGIGLGLAIAKRMVELMGGTIGVQSDEGVGSTFNFSLYCQRQDT